jgi:hypothetical protein
MEQEAGCCKSGGYPLDGRGILPLTTIPMVHIYHVLLFLVLIFSESVNFMEKLNMK